MEFRSRYKLGERKAGFKCEGVTRTIQGCKEQCDINNIIAKYKKTGVLPVGRNSMPQFGDFTDVQEYQDSMNKLISANDAFMQLPSGIRKRFGNDPALLIEFCADSKNYDEALKLGLVSARQVVSENVSTSDTASKDTGDNK